MTHNIMEQASQPFNNNTAENECPRGDPDNKRLKELRNAALQTSLTSRMEADSTADSEVRPIRETAEEEPSNGVSFNHNHRSDEHQAAPGPVTETREEGAEEDETDSNLTKEEVAEQQRTQTDHLNKRLLSSFLEKLNVRDLALPGVQHLDCAVAEEDSNRAAEEW
ncbi:unnamed protein product [Lota lota]